MAITGDSKFTIKNEIEILEQKKNRINIKIQELKDKRDLLILQRDSVNTKINNLKSDSV